MLLPRSILAAETKQQNRRQRLFAGGSLLLFGATVSFLLTYMFPRQALVRTVTEEHDQPLMHNLRNDTLTVSYLENLLRTEQDNVDLRRLLAEMQLKNGDFKSFDKTIEPMLISAQRSVRQEGLYLRFSSLWAQLQAAGKQDHIRVAKLAELRLLFPELRQYDWAGKRMVMLMSAAHTLGDSRLAYELAVGMSEKPHRLSGKELDRIAKQALGEGNYVLSASAYFAMMRTAAQKDDRREYFLTGMRVLLSGNLYQQMVVEATHQIGDLADDPATLYELIQMMRSANQLDEAERYMRRLLKISLYRELLWLAGRHSDLRSAAYDGGAGWLRVADDPRRKRQGEGAVINPNDTLPVAPEVIQPLLKLPENTRVRVPFDEKIYTLGYDVFLAKGNHQDAYLVAKAAVDQQPGNMAWRTRLAKVLEWLNQPEQAIKHWVEIGKNTHNPEAWEAVRRLAPGLNDDESLLAYWRHRGIRGNMKEEDWRNMAALFEKASQAREGAMFFREQGRNLRDVVPLELAAYLHDRVGDDQEAIEDYRVWAELLGWEPKNARRAAALLITHHQFDDALRVLTAAMPRATAKDGDFWLMLADLAYQLQQRPTAIQAYTALLGIPGAYGPGEAERLVDLLRFEEPAVAIPIARKGWSEFHTRSLYFQLAGLLDRQAEWGELKTLLLEPPEAQLHTLREDIAYWSLLSNAHRGLGERKAALAALQRGLKANPGADSLRLAVLWELIDQGRDAELRPLLGKWRPIALNNPGYWGAYASGYLTIGEARKALPWYRKQLQQNPQDYLWWMNYADALDQALYGDLAWRVRQHIWFEFRKNPPLQLNNKAQRDMLVVNAKLAMRFARSEVAQKVLRDLASGAAFVKAGTSTEESSAAQELAMAWMFSQEAHEAVRGWLWRRYAAKLEQPAWARLFLALHFDDHQQLDDLLTKQLDKLPIYDRIDAANELRRRRLAQELAWGDLDRNEDEEQIHQRFLDRALDTVNSTIGRAHYQRVGDLTRRGLKLRGEYRWYENWLIHGEIDQARQQGRNAMVDIPDRERGQTLGVSYRRKYWETTAEITRREDLNHYTGWLARQSWEWGRRVNGSVTLAKRQAGVESDRFMVGVHRDYLQLDGTYHFGSHEVLYVQLARNRYHSQFGEYLGQGTVRRFQFWERLRLERPDIVVRLYRDYNVFRADGNFDPRLSRLFGPELDASLENLMPKSSSTTGLSLGWGTHYQEHYHRGQRWFGELGIARNNISGTSANWLLGYGGTLLGNDYLSVAASSAKSSGSSQPSKELWMRWQLMF